VSRRSRLRLHAIYAVLDDVALFRASVRSVYEHVDRITVITTHDVDWRGLPREPSGLVSTVLARDLDPDRKIDLIVTSERNEARERNRAMDYAAPRRESWDVRRQSADDPGFEPPDYFLIIDADEIYEEGALERLSEYVDRDGRRPIYRVPCVRYFKRWNYRVDGYEWPVALVRADRRLEHLRARRANLARRAAARAPGVPQRARDALRGFADVPPEVAVFHHGSYVGPRSRIEAKIAAWGHADEVESGWLDDVWDNWTPSMRDFNPVYPNFFHRATEISPDTLPPEIRAVDWPSEYLES
jgi:hypothetical protein